MEDSKWHSQHSDLFIGAGSSLVVHPAADMPKIAVESGPRLVIITQGETLLDRLCHLRFTESAGEVMHGAATSLKEIQR